MSLLALPAATVYVTDPQLTAAPLGAAETALGANTGATFLNDPDGLVVVRIVIGASGAGNVTFVGRNGNPNVVKAVANSSVYLYGPFDPAQFSDVNGMVTVNFSVQTGNSIGVYLVPAKDPLTTFRALHNPFQTTHGAADR